MRPKVAITMILGFALGFSFAGLVPAAAVKAWPALFVAVPLALWAVWKLKV